MEGTVGLRRLRRHVPVRPGAGRRRRDRRRRGPRAAPARAGRPRAGAAPPAPHRLTALARSPERRTGGCYRRPPEEANRGLPTPMPQRVQKLHLVGSTTDQTGLILSARRGARSGSYTLVARRRARPRRSRSSGPARRRRPTADGRAGARPPRVESRLPIGEIQARLRRGAASRTWPRTPASTPSGSSASRRRCSPSRPRSSRKVQGTFLQRARLGPSGMRIGDAVRRNLAERGVVDVARRVHARRGPPTSGPTAAGSCASRSTTAAATKTLKFEVRPNGDVSRGRLVHRRSSSYVTPPKRPRRARSPRAAPGGGRHVGQAGGREHRLPARRRRSRPCRARPRSARRRPRR